MRKPRNPRAKDPERAREYDRKSRAKNKADLFAAYGNKCACCGEDRPQFLSLDHINGDGGEHRRRIGGATVLIYRDVKKQGYPKDRYRLLCFNCNMAYGLYGKCPHKHKGPFVAKFVGKIPA